MPPPKHSSAKDRAYEYVKSNIINEVFKQGTFITEEEVAKSLGISRTPVREAFSLLAYEGFIKIFPQRGVLIPVITNQDMIEVMEVRELIELFSADRLISQRKLIADMRMLLLEQEHFRNTLDVQQFIDCDRRFHNLIVRASGNSLLIGIHEGLRDKLLRMGVRAVMNSTERMNQVIEEHREILQAAEREDGIQIRQAIQHHLHATLSVLLAQRS